MSLPGPQPQAADRQATPFTHTIGQTRGLYCLTGVADHDSRGEEICNGAGAIGDNLIPDDLSAGSIASWAWDHKGEIATGIAVVTCIAASFGVCAAVSVTALGARTWDTFEEQGWEEGRGDVALDAGLTFLTLGVGGVADEGLRVAGPLTSNSGSIVFAPGSKGLEWVGRGLFGLFDLAMFGANLAALSC